MSYTPTTWTTGDTVTASAMNKIEQGIAGASPWDAVIKLTHANNSDMDGASSLTPSIISGTYADLRSKITNGGCPCILVQYFHPWGYQYSAPMAYVTYVGSDSVTINVAGFSAFNEGSTWHNFGSLVWSASGIEWD